MLLVISMLVTMVWLAGRYEASQVQTKLERDTADAISDIRVALTRNLQSLQALHAGDPAHLAWEVEAAELLRSRRELVRIEWRDTHLRMRTYAQSPYRPVAWDARLREGNQSDAAIACVAVFGRFSAVLRPFKGTVRAQVARTVGIGVLKAALRAGGYMVWHGILLFQGKQWPGRWARLLYRGARFSSAKGGRPLSRRWP